MRYEDYLSELGDYERHLNNLQLALRGLASSWLLAAAAGIGTVMLADESNLSGTILTREDLVSSVTMIASVGIVSLWFLDQFVYHRLLNGVFLSALALELSDETALPMRMSMVHRNPNGASFIVCIFYTSCIAALGLVSFTTSVQTNSTICEWSAMQSASVIAAIISISTIIILRARSSGMISAKNSEFGKAIGDFWRALPEERRDLIVKRYRRGDD